MSSVVNYFPNREMSKVVYNQLNSLEVTFEKQREKLKLDQMITQLSNQDNPNETIRSDLENHKRELKNVIQVISILLNRLFRREHEITESKSIRHEEYREY